jgi:hypothetical protein
MPDTCIVDKCKLAWDEEFIPGIANKNNCSGFVKAVAKKLGIPISATANADGIVAELAGAWSEVSTGAEAALKAAAGSLVIVGLKGADHKPARANGHVAIVVSGALYRNKYPLCWGGSIGGAQSAGTKSVGEIWNRNDRDSVKYFVYGTAACPAK